MGESYEARKRRLLAEARSHTVETENAASTEANGPSPGSVALVGVMMLVLPIAFCCGCPLILWRPSSNPHDDSYLSEAQAAANDEHAATVARQERKAAARDDKKLAAAFMSLLEIAGDGVVESAYVNGETITLSVNNIWHIRAYQIRLQDAQTLFAVWVRLYRETDDDKQPLFSIVDFNGNEVGGYSIWSGVWVQEK